MEIHEAQTKIKRVKKIIIHQIKNSTWRKGYRSYKNELVEFDNCDGGWVFQIKVGNRFRSEGLKLIMNPIEFWFYVIFYIQPKIRKSNELERNENLADLCDQFIDSNKKVVRSAKLTELFKSDTV